MEPTDHSCERCGRTDARLIFDQWSKLLLCENCLECMRWQQTWSLLREAEMPEAQAGSSLGMNELRREGK